MPNASKNWDWHKRIQLYKPDNDAHRYQPIERSNQLDFNVFFSVIIMKIVILFSFNFSYKFNDIIQHLYYYFTIFVAFTPLY